MKQTILITGVAGFIGSSFAKALEKEDYNLIGIDDLSSSTKSQVPKNLIFFKEDLSKKIPKKLESKNIKIDYIFHFAGQSSGEISFENPILDLKKNTISTLNLINFSIKKNIKRFFYMSSMSVYGDSEHPNEKTNFNPKTCYGVSKISSELYLKVFEKEINYTIFRLFNVYGPSQKLNNLKQGMIRIYMTQFLKNNKIEVKGSLNRSRDFIFIDDVVEVFIKALKHKSKKNQIINIGTGKKTSINKIIKIFKQFDRNLKVKIKKGTKGDQKNIYANNNYLKSIYNITNFTNIDKGIRIFYENLKK